MLSCLNNVFSSPVFQFMTSVYPAWTALCIKCRTARLSSPCCPPFLLFLSKSVLLHKSICQTVKKQSQMVKCYRDVGKMWS